jgi:hypothetical protein
VGDSIGALVFTLNLGSLALGLLDCAHEHSFLGAQATFLSEIQARECGRLATILERTEFLRALPEGAQLAAGRVASLLRSAPRIEGPPPHEERRARFDAVVAACDACGVEQALANR